MPLMLECHFFNVSIMGGVGMTITCLAVCVLLWSNAILLDFDRISSKLPR